MTQRDRIMLGVIAAVAVLAASWMLAIKPKRQEASDLADQAAQAQQRRDAAVSALATAKQARDEFATAQASIARMGKAVPTDDDVATLVFQLERSAAKAGIDFRSVELTGSASNPTPSSGPGTAAPAGGVTDVPFNLTFEGEFFELRRFLDHIKSFAKAEGEKLDIRGRLMAVEGVSLIAGEGGFPNIKAQIAAKAYQAPAPSAAGAAGAAGGAAAGAAPGAAGTTPETSGAGSSATTATVTGVTR